jgi:hypothetical protein
VGFGYFSGLREKIEISKLVNPAKWSLRARLLIASAACLLLGITALGFFVYYTLENTFEKAIQDRLALVDESVRNELRKDQEILLSLVASLASIPDVVQDLAAQDREKLMSCVLPYVDRVRNSTGYQSLFFHFHIAPGISFLRSWNVNRWGDELSNTRPFAGQTGWWKPSVLTTTTFCAPSSGAVSIHKTVSVGISEYPQDADTFYKAIKYADVALYEAKQAGRNRVVRFEPAMWTQEEY